MKENTSHFLIALALTALYVFFVYRLSFGYNIPSGASLQEEESEDTTAFVIPASDTALLTFLYQMEAWFPELIVAQAKLESGNYTSNIFLNANNPFGMTVVSKRETTQIGEYHGFGAYNHWMDACVDRIHWDNDMFSKKPHREDYVAFLSNYASDSLYIEKVMQIERQLLKTHRQHINTLKKRPKMDRS